MTSTRFWRPIAKLLPLAIVGLASVLGLASHRFMHRMNGRVLPFREDLGVLGAGSKLKLAVRLENNSWEPSDLSDVASTCDCVTVTTPRLHIEPGGSSKLLLDVDTSLDSDFRGNLSVGISGTCRSGRIELGTVNLTIR